MKIHISRDGQTFGPYSLEQVREHLQTANVIATDLAWQEGMTEWKPLYSLPGFEHLSPYPYSPPMIERQPSYHHISTLKLIIFSVCSLGLYEIYWFYKNWKFVRDRDNSSISPFWRAVFSPVWAGSLAKDVANTQAVQSQGIPVVIGLTYFMIAGLSWRLPDPYWLVSLFSFVPLLWIAREIDAINRQNSIRSNYYTRFGPLPIVGCLFGSLLLFLATASTLQIFPDTKVIEGERVPKRQVTYLRENEILNDSEVLLYFYSTGFFSSKGEGNLITTERVTSYETDEDGNLSVYSAEYKDIENIEVFYSESFLDDTIVTIILPNEDEFYLVLSTEEGKDKVFVDKLMALWKQHRTEANLPISQSDSLPLPSR